MQFNIVFIATALLASASLAMSATITGFAGADCTGTQGESFWSAVWRMFHFGRRLDEVNQLLWCPQ